MRNFNLPIFTINDVAEASAVSIMSEVLVKFLELFLASEKA